MQINEIVIVPCMVLFYVNRLFSRMSVNFPFLLVNAISYQCLNGRLRKH